MSSATLPNSKEEYDVIEGGLGAALFVTTLIILISLTAIYICCSNRNERWESFHSILGVFYFSFTERQAIDHVQPAAPQPVLLIWKRSLPIGANRYLTYIYYYLMAIMSCMWFISFAVDDTIFQKTTTCNDLNPNDMSHVCFAVNESYTIVDCTVQQMEPVICYIFNLNFAGIGIAYSVTKLCLALVDVYYFLLMKVTVKCAPVIIGLRSIAIAGAFIGFSIWWGVFSTVGKYTRQDYFGYGLVPMRVMQSVFAFLTTLIATGFPPWRLGVGTKQSFRDVAASHSVQDAPLRCGGHPVG